MNDLLNEIAGLETFEELEQVRKALKIRTAEVYNQKENFMMHDKTDDYIYLIRDKDGNPLWRHYLGKTAYEYYMRNQEAWSIERYEKTLRPWHEPLLCKDPSIC